MTATFRAVILGGDIGAYASARAFHEAYGEPAVVLAGVRTGPVADSSILSLRIVPGLDTPGALVGAVRAVAAERPDLVHLVIGSADWFVHELSVRRAELTADGARIVVPYAEPALLEAVTDKAAFSRLCTELGIPHPVTVILRPGDEVPADLPWPVVVKAASTAEFHAVEFEGKHKVEFLDDAPALRGYLAKVGGAGYSGEFVVQEHIPGGDDAMAAVNVFVGPDARPRLALFGRVLLEEHTPNGLGNSVAQITAGEHAHDAAVGHALRLLEHVGWTGFANVDLKRGTDGVYRFFEVNPRVGRSGYAVTAAGYNVGRMYGEAFVDGVPGPAAPEIGTNEHLFTVVPIALIDRYVDAGTRAQIRRLRRAGAVTNPYYYRAERNPRRWLYLAQATLNQFRKFRRWH